MSANPTPYIDKDEETVLQRTRRRIAQGRCPACGAPNKNRAQRILCLECRKTKKYCPQCEQVLYRAIFTDDVRSNDGKAVYCPPCRAQIRSSEAGRLTDYDRYRKRREASGHQVQTRAEIDARVRELERKIVRLVSIGATLHEASDILGVNYNTVKERFRLWKKRAMKEQQA